MTLDDVRALVLKEAEPFKGKREGRGIRKWCEAKGVSASHTFEFMNGDRLPCSDLLEALGLEWRIAVKVKKGGQGGH